MQKQIRISAKGIAKFMNSSEAKRLKILRDFKYPNPEGNAMASYYSIALGIIKTYHRNENNETFLKTEISILKSQLDSEENKSKRIKLRSNIGLLESYMRNFKDKRYDILSMLCSNLEIEGVTLSIRSDIHAIEKNSEKFIKYICSKDKTSELEIKIISQIIFESIEPTKYKISSKNVELIDIRRGTIHTLARNNARIKSDLKAACKFINMIWDKIEK